jgi:predicted RND superfamily exporter protein
MFAGYTHNKDLTAAGVICLIERPGAGKTPRREILAKMREAIHGYERGALVGEPVMIEEAFDLLEQDGQRLNTWCTVLVLLTIYVCLRSLRWLILPLAVIQLTLALTNATLVLSGLELSMVSSMLGAIITVVGVASVVHVMVHYLDERRDGAGRRRALINTLDHLAAPITVAIFTDGAGFAALMVSRVGPVHDFGLMMALGSLLVLPACILLAPGMTWLCDYGRPAEKSPDDRLTLGPWLAKSLDWSNRHIILLTVTAIALSVFGLIGSNRLELETDFTANFRQHSDIVQEYDFVETHFGGAGVWDLLVPAPAAGKARMQPSAANGRLPAPPPLSKDVLRGLLKVERQLKQQSPELTKAISIADSLAAQFGSARSLLTASAITSRITLGAMRAAMPEFMDSLYAVDPEDGRPWLHILLRAPERLPAEKKASLIDRVHSTAAAQFPGAEATGDYVLLTRLIESVLADQWKAFIVATAVILAMMLLAIRDWRLTGVTLVPNIFPSLVLFGVMGFLGLKVNMGAAMIAAVSIGMSVDSSTHYTMFYQRLRRNGLSLDAALLRSQHSVGRASVFSTLALTVGFGTLCVSEFIPTIYFGALVSLSMIGGLIGNLLILPVLIRLVDRRKEGDLNTVA